MIGVAYLHIFSSDRWMYHRPNIAPQALRKGRAPHLILIDDTKLIAKNQSVNIGATTLRGECYVEAGVPEYWIYIFFFFLIYPLVLSNTPEMLDHLEGT